MLQAELFTPHFDGDTYDHKRDFERLNSQLGRVYRALKTGRKFTLSYLALIVHAKEQSVSARIRDLRKAKFGGHTIHKENIGGGTWVYWMETKTGG